MNAFRQVGYDDIITGELKATAILEARMINISTDMDKIGNVKVGRGAGLPYVPRSRLGLKPEH